MGVATSYHMVKCLVISMRHYLQNNAQKQGLYRRPNFFFFFLNFISLHLLLQLPPPIKWHCLLQVCSWVRGQRDILHRQVDFVSSLLKEKQQNNTFLKHSVVTVELVGDEHFPTHQLKSKNCCQFAQNQ